LFDCLSGRHLACPSVTAATSSTILKKPIAPANDGVAVFIAPDEQLSLDVKIDAETVWLALADIAKLFNRDKSVVSRHLHNVFTARELDRKSVVAKNATTAPDGKTYAVEYFNLDAILSVGYRVNSKRGTQVRIWATKTLRDHLLKGFAANERRLAQRGLSDMQATIRPARQHTYPTKSCQ
jgi:hypothetical protein